MIDVAINLANNKGASAGDLEDVELRLAAKALDSAIVSTIGMTRYIQQAEKHLITLKRHFMGKGMKSCPNITWIEEERLQEILEQPLSSLSIEQLRVLNLESLVLNPVAIEQLNEEYSENWESYSSEWLKIVEAEGELQMHKDGDLLPPIPLELQESLGFNFGTEEFIGAQHLVTRGQTDTGADTGSARRAVPGFPRQFLAHELRFVSGLAPDHPKAFTVFLDHVDDSLFVRTTGLGLIEPGCVLELRWFDSENDLLGEFSGKDIDQEVRMESNLGWLRGQKLEMRFRSSRIPSYEFHLAITI